MKSGSLNPLEPTGSVQASTGIALSLPFTFAATGIENVHAHARVHILKTFYNVSGNAEQIL